MQGLYVLPHPDICKCLLELYMTLEGAGPDKDYCYCLRSSPSGAWSAASTFWRSTLCWDALCSVLRSGLQQGGLQSQDFSIDQHISAWARSGFRAVLKGVSRNKPVNVFLLKPQRSTVLTCLKESEKRVVLYTSILQSTLESVILLETLGENSWLIKSYQAIYGVGLGWTNGSLVFHLIFGRNARGGNMPALCCGDYRNAHEIHIFVYLCILPQYNFAVY